MKPAKFLTRSLFLTPAVLIWVLLPSAALADEPTQAPQTHAVKGTTGAIEIHETIVITVERQRPDGFFEHYIFTNWLRLDLTVQFAESEEANRIAPEVLESAEYVMAALDPAPWKQDHIGITLFF